MVLQAKEKMKRFEEVLKKIYNYPQFEVFLFLILLSIGIFIRAFHFGTSPIGIHQDEAMAAVDAKALLEYGTDRFGMRYPVHFTAWGNSQMSVLLSYCMIPFIKVFGYSITAIRIPLLIISSIGLAMVYVLGRKAGGVKLAVAFSLMTIACPWHYMQSRWSIDCNMFPHMFLIGVCLLLIGIGKKRYLYISMIFFAFCSYCYGIANYSVPLFLFFMAVFLCCCKKVNIKEIIISIVIYVLLVLPEFLTMFINMFGLESIETPFFTIPYFQESERSHDILFMNFSWDQLLYNIKRMFAVVWCKEDTSVVNAIETVGPLYDVTVVFFIIGLFAMIGKCKKTISLEKRLPYIAILAWLVMGIWVGVVTRSVTIHRINIIFYPIVMIASIGIVWCIEKWRLLMVPIGAIYAAYALSFAVKYFGEWSDISRIYYYETYLNALEYAETLLCDYYYIAPDPQGVGEKKVGEILTLFSHEIDALYYQGKSNMQKGVELLPFEERYHFEDVTREILNENINKEVVYIVHAENLELFSEEEYVIDSFYDTYYVIQKK